MRGSLFSLRSGANSAVGSPVQTPAVAPTPHVSHSQTNSRPDSGAFVSDVEPLTLPPSAAPTATDARPSSRPLGRLGLTGFRKASPAPRARESSVNGTNAVGLTPPASPVPAPTSVSYLDGLSLRLGEAVSKALILPSTPPVSVGMGIAKATHVAPAKSTALDGAEMVLKGRKPLPPGRGRALGALISGELQSGSQDPFLYRAVLRLLQRPLSVLLTNLTTQVTNLILTPDFAYMSTIVPFNATQIHALALAHFASELLETFDAVGLGRRSQVAPDGLRSEKEALENVVSRVTNPFLTTVKHEIANATAEFKKNPAASTALCQLEKTLHRCGPVLTKVTFAGEPHQSQFVQSLLAQTEISTIWNCLTALAERPLPRPGCEVSPGDSGSELRKSVSASELRARSVSDASAMKPSGGEQSPTSEYISQLPSYVTPPDTPQVAPVRDGSPEPEKQQMKEREKEKCVSFGASAKGVTSGQTPLSRTFTPPTPPASKKLSLPKLPSLRPLTTRAPSPPIGLHSAIQEKAPLPLSTSTSSSSLASWEATAVDIVLPALKNLAKDTSVISVAIKKLPLPLEGGLARDAVDEASREMDGFYAFLEYLTTGPSLQSCLTDVDSLLRKSRATPMLLAMPILLRVALATCMSARGIADVAPDTIAGWIGLSDVEYRETCLSAFGKADECAPIVGKAFTRNKMVGALGWMKEWAERSTQEEEDSEDSEDEETH